MARFIDSRGRTGIATNIVAPPPFRNRPRLVYGKFDGAVKMGKQNERNVSPDIDAGRYPDREILRGITAKRTLVSDYVYHCRRSPEQTARGSAVRRHSIHVELTDILRGSVSARARIVRRHGQHSRRVRSRPVWFVVPSNKRVVRLYGNASTRQQRTKRPNRVRPVNFAIPFTRLIYA